MAGGRMREPRDVLGLSLDEAKAELTGWSVEVVVTAPPRRAGEGGTVQSLADTRVLRQSVAGKGEVMVLTVAPESAPHEKERLG